MVERILKFSLRNRYWVVGAAIALMVIGMYRSFTIPVDVFPDLTAPRVTVVTESTGMASEEVEQLITLPIETLVGGVSGLRRVRSASASGISVVWAEFDWDTDSVVARQRVTERLQSLGDSLPPEAGPPTLGPASSVMGEIAFVALSSELVSMADVRRTAEVAVRRRLLAVKGISQVVPIGGDVKQYQILVNPNRLETYKLSIADVVAAIKLGSRNVPGGYLVEGGQESVVRVLGRANGIADLQAIVVATRGVDRKRLPIHIRDVAEVKVGAAISRGTASYDTKPAVLISIVKQPDADTSSTTVRIDDALNELEPSLRALGITIHRKIFRQQDFIDNALNNVVGVLRDGAIFVALVLFLFMWSIRPTVISVVAIPVSLVVAILVLDGLGLTIDTMTLGGLAIAIGELVDDAIVDVENVSRRLRERALQPKGERSGVVATVLSASLEIRSAIVSATCILMLVFVPLLMLDGMEGRLLQPLAIAYLVAILASLLVAVTITPVLCVLLLPQSVEKTSGGEPPLIRWLLKGYTPVLRIVLEKKWSVIAATTLLVGVAVYGLTGAKRSFLPEFNEGSLTINMVLAPGTALDQSNVLGTMAEEILSRDPGVLSVGRRTGRAERDEHVLGVETTEFEVRIKDDDSRTRAQLFSDIRERLKTVPAQFTIGQPISHRIEHMISGQRSALAVKVFGDDLDELRRIAASVKAVMGDVPGIVDLNEEQIAEIPQVVVRVNAQVASRYGFSAGEAATSIGTALWGQRATQVYEEGQNTDVVVKYSTQAVSDLEALRRLRVPTPSGAMVPISAFADVGRENGPNYILRENVSRRLVVSANVEGGDIRGTYREVRRRVDAKIRLPKGVRIQYAGQFEREEATQRRLVLFGLLAIVGISFIVVRTLNSVRRALIVLVNLPLALTGGVVGVYLAGGGLSVATTIGFITLFGIATRNGILLATRTKDLEEEGYDRIFAVVRAGQERLAPILMTAVTAALGLLPLALGLGKAGSEIQAPMAIVILTGLTTSTILNMIVIPVLLAHWGGTIRARRA